MRGETYCWFVVKSSQRLQYISKTGGDSRGLQGTPGEKKRCGNSKFPKR
jgi:hypothetical protein